MDTAIFEKYGLKPLEPLLETEQITMWKMTQPAIHRTVLVHVLGPSTASDPDAVAYLFSVVRSISNTSAPAIAQVYTIFDEPDLKAVVSEYVDGLSLEQTVSALGPLSMKQTIRTGIAVAEALKDVWDASHILFRSVRPEFITLDAGSTAKLVSPCYAQVAPAEMAVPESDMSDLGELLYFLATGVHSGQAHAVSLPREFTAFLERLSSESAMSKFASWDSVIEALRALENLKPASASGKASKSSKQEGSDSSTKSPRLVMEPKQGSSAIRAARAAARARAMEEDRRSSGAGAKFFASVVLIVVLGCVFVMRIGHEELKVRMETYGRDGSQTAAVPQQGGVLSGDAPQPVSQRNGPADVDSSGLVERPQVEVASSAQDEGEQDEVVTPEPVVPVVNEPDPDDALTSYLAKHVGDEVPFLYKGEERTVTLVSYTADTVTIRTRKILTLNRSELSPEQLALWK